MIYSSYGGPADELLAARRAGGAPTLAPVGQGNPFPGPAPTSEAESSAPSMKWIAIGLAAAVAGFFLFRKARAVSQMRFPL